MLELQNVSKRYGNFSAVKDISLTVNEGCFFGFLGPNGAGKTTTIKMIAGLLSPTSGKILINGVDMSKQPVRAKEQIGYIPDQPFLYDRLTGKEFLFFTGGLYKMEHEAVKTKVEEVIDTLEIGNWVHRRTEEYSQGMRQRVVIASALLHEPKFILVDEPMVGLDPQSANIVKQVFRQKAASGTAIVMSTHSLHIAEEVCERIGVIKDGEFIFNDSLESLKNFQAANYKNLESFFLELVQ
jgi:ABC-2 type transport system ATP-binding protein